MTNKNKVATVVLSAAFAVSTLAVGANIHTPNVYAEQTQQSPKSGFVDVPDSHPYSQYIADLRQKGKISGYDYLRAGEQPHSRRIRDHAGQGPGSPGV
ncbi:MAG: hypothetical protein QJR06_10110 [Alicyclobacillaceae bacterium]|nr:hypothetical protein [Alicyclobacillaceae bacterium]